MITYCDANVNTKSRNKITFQKSQYLKQAKFNIFKLYVPKVAMLKRENIQCI